MKQQRKSQVTKEPTGRPRKGEVLLICLELICASGITHTFV